MRRVAVTGLRHTANTGSRFVADAVAPTVHQAYRYALDPTPAQERLLASHAGASRFAYNRMLAEVKSTLTAREWEGRLLGGCLTPTQGWSLAALRRTWNANEESWAPWWRECSKEAFDHGLECLAAALKNWTDARDGKRAGGPVGFPRFKKRGDRASFASTTGSIQVGDDRRSVQLPRIGRLHVHENTRKLHRRLARGTARILRATVSRDAAGRWYGMGRRKAGLGARGRGFNRAIADASLAEVRRQLAYKTTWYRSRLVVADRWFPSSKTCSGCGRRKPSLPLSERTYHCDDPACGLVIDRDLNAAVNLAHLGVPSAGSGPGDVNDGRGADREPDPAQAGDVGGNEASTPHPRPRGKTGTATPRGEAA